MIEAVNAVVSNAQLLRSVAEQTSTTQTISANPAKVQSAAIIAPYLSPHVDYNGGNTKPIFVVRDAATGETVKQFPSEAQIRAYQRAAKVQEQAAAQIQFQQNTGGADEAQAAAQRSADIAKSSIEFKQARQAVKQQTEMHIGGGGGKVGRASSSAGSGDTAEVPASVDTQV